MTEMKQYLAIETLNDEPYQLVFSSPNLEDAEDFCADIGAELCGEITMTSAP